MKKYLSRLLAALLALTLLVAPASALTVDEALELLEDAYYYDIPDEAYQASTLEELFWLLGDPYTGYLSEEQYQTFMGLVEGDTNLVGIGIMSYFTDQGILVNEVVSGGGAEGAGLQAGDLIVAIDGVSCVPAAESHRELIVGAEGTKVTISVLRDGKTQDYTITRRTVYIPNTQFSVLEGGIGYVDCDSFGSDTGKLFLDGLREYDSQVDYWVLDLRDNAGGYVDSAADVLAALGGPGAYVYFEDKDGQVAVYTRRTRAASRKPVLLLVNGASASASEAVAAGIRDMNLGITIGSRTYGKGVGQVILDEETYPEYFDGDGLKVTTGRFYSVGGTTTDRIGVIPTLLVNDAYTEAVSAALCGGSSETSALGIIVDGVPFYVDLDADSRVLAALFEALSPQVDVFYGGKGLSIPQAAEKLGLDYNSRWFDDLGDSRYAYAINSLATYRLLSGTASGEFSPKEQLTRAQLCVMLARVFNVTAPGSSRFSDVPSTAWYAGEVNAMAILGLVDGVGEGRFDPDSPLTQEQFLTIMGRVARYLNFVLDSYGKAVEGVGDGLPLDMELGLGSYHDWARSSVAVLAWGVEDALEGDGNMLYTSLGRISPSALILREEAAAGIYAVLAKLEILP